MIVWRGLGFLGVLIPIILLVILDMVDKTHKFQYGETVVLILSAIGTWFLGKKLNGAPGKVLIDPQTNQEVVLKDKHTLFWIPLEYFAFVWAVFAIFVLFKP